MKINIYEGAKNLEKNAKMALMKGFILGTLVLSGGTTTIAHAQDNGVAVKTEYNNDVNIVSEDEVKLDLPIGGYKPGDGVYDIGVGSPETIPNMENYVYDLYMVDDLGNIIKQISSNVPCGTVTVASEESKYYAVIKEKDTEKIYGKTKTIDTKIFKTTEEIRNEIKRNIPISGYVVEDGKMYDIGVGNPDFLEENVEYVYDLYMVDENDNIIKKVYEDVPFGTVSVVKEQGRYYAEFKEKETKKIYGVTGTIDTINMKVGSGYVGTEYEYYSDLHDYFSGKLTLRDATHTGGATSFWYDAIARGISMETDMNFEEVRDAIINLNLNIIAGTDSEQLDILFQEEVNYTRLEENTDKVLSSLVNREYFGLNNLAGDYNDHVVLLELDNIYNLISTTNKSYILASDYVELKNTLDFFISNGEIKGHKFEELTDGGKRLALVSYEKIKRMVNAKYNSYNEINEVPNELSELYQITNSMDVLTVATILNATNLLTYEFNREAIAPVGVEVFDVYDGYFEQCVKRYDRIVPSFAGKSDKLKSTFFINNFDKLSSKLVIENFGQNIDIHTEFTNMEEYLNSVLEHNSTHSIKEHVSLVNTLPESDGDKFDIAYLESFYKVIKYELETNKLNENHVSAILRWVLDYYNGFYIDNPGVEVKYTEHLSNGGMLVANNLLNQYKVLLRNIKTNNNEVNILIEEVNKINLWQETKAAEQIIYDDFDKLQESLNYYTIVRGDTLWKIAQRYGMSAQQLYDLNRDTIDNPNLIFPGQKIKTNLSYDYEEQFRK